MSNQLFKSPRGRNKFSGNVSLSHEEWELIKNGEYSTLRVEGQNFDFTKPIEQWMIDHADVNDNYVLFPYTEKSYLVKGRYQE